MNTKFISKNANIQVVAVENNPELQPNRTRQRGERQAAGRMLVIVEVTDADLLNDYRYQRCTQLSIEEAAESEIRRLFILRGYEAGSFIEEVEDVKLDGVELLSTGAGKFFGWLNWHGLEVEPEELIQVDVDHFIPAKHERDDEED